MKSFQSSSLIVNVPSGAEAVPRARRCAPRGSNRDRYRRCARDDEHGRGAPPPLRGAHGAIRLERLSELRRKHFGARRAVRRRATQGLIDSGRQAIGQLGSEGPQGRKSAVPMRRAKRVQGAAAHRKCPRQQPERQHSGAVDIRLRCRSMLPEQDLRREIHRRPDEIERRWAVGVAARMKVHQDDASRWLAHDVLRFQIPMKEARVVHRLEGATDRDGNLHHLGGGQWASARVRGCRGCGPR